MHKNILGLLTTSFISFYRAIIGMSALKAISYYSDPYLLTTFINSQNITGMLLFSMSLGSANLLTISAAKNESSFDKYLSSINTYSIFSVIIIIPFFCIFNWDILNLISAVILVFFNRICAILIGKKMRKKYNQINFLSYTVSIILLLLMIKRYTLTGSQLFFIFNIPLLISFIAYSEVKSTYFAFKNVDLKPFYPHFFSSLSLLVLPSAIHIFIRGNLLEKGSVLAASCDVLWKFSALALLLPSTLISIYILPEIEKSNLNASLKNNRDNISIILFGITVYGILYSLFFQDVVGFFFSEQYSFIYPMAMLFLFGDMARIISLFFYNYILASDGIWYNFRLDLVFWITYLTIFWFGNKILIGNALLVISGSYLCSSVLVLSCSLFYARKI